ncbi:MAG: ArsR family transcriptional regulator [Thermoanaerobaculia bacterium]|jgi:predicted transcriptional regulator
MLDILKESPGCNVNEVSEFFDMTRIAVMKHLRVLEEADLVVSKKRGRARHLYFNVVPIQMVYDRWSTEYSALWARSMTRLKYKIESEEENG